MPLLTDLLPADTRAFLTVEETAALLSLSVKTVLRRIADESLVAIRTGAVRGRIRIPRAALERYLVASRA